MAMIPNMRRTATILLLPILASLYQTSAQSDQRFVPIKKAKLMHKPGQLSRSQINILADLIDFHHMENVLENICIARVVGTPGHSKVKQYIKSTLQDLNWDIESDVFEDSTPLFGRLKFENIIARWNPNARRFLTLACHYDSKYEKDYEFIGAIDSAVPCMQLINLAKVMQNQLNLIKDNDLSLMLLFFDGEEAFLKWGPKDSLYGARHLASKWHKKKYNFENERLSGLDQIDLFVLLDLIGTPQPIFYSYSLDTVKWYYILVNAEQQLANDLLFENYLYDNPRHRYFQNYTIFSGVEDDHTPFINKNVPVLHLIPHPFPDVWHTAGDNRNAVSMSTVENLNKILRVFVATYLNMDVQRKKLSFEFDYDDEE